LTFGYLVVEGTHDVAFIGRLLRTFGLRRVKLLKHLQPFWKPLVPPTFPFKDDLLKRVPVPAFFEGADHSVAVDSAVGVARLTPALEETLAQLGSARSELRSIGMFLDADWSKKPSDAFDELKAKLEFFGVVMPPQGWLPKEVSEREFTSFPITSRPARWKPCSTSVRWPRTRAYEPLDVIWSMA